MLNRSVLAGFLAIVPALAACRGPQVAVIVLAGDEGQEQPVADHPLEFIPFDRDSVFTALIASSPEPEPQVPDDLRDQLAQVAGMQDQWRVAEGEWADAREQLQSLSNRLERLDSRSREYRQLYQQFDGLESRERTLNQRRQAAFQQFDDAQKAALGRADSIRAVIEAWEDVAFIDYVDIETQILENAGKEIVFDTTNAEGLANQALSKGTWFIHARVSLPFSELYWNVAVDPSATDTVRLTPENAEVRLRL